MMSTQMEQLLSAMISYETGSPKRAQHLVKVYTFSKLIGLGENLDPHTLLVLEAAAAVHDIGIRRALELCGYSSGKLQEELGPPEAEKILASLSFPRDVIDRVCWLIAHHHTYTGVTEQDHRVLIEADFLVNTEEDPAMHRSAGRIYVEQMKTKTGRAFYRSLFPEAAPED